jgi:GxxExxY protein
MKNIQTMSENQIATIIVNLCYMIHSKLGPGLLETVYEQILCFELQNMGLKVDRQKAIPLEWKEIQMDIGFRADLIVEDKVIVELKSVEKMNPVYPKQLLTYLKITKMKLGLLINFNEELIRDGIKRIVNNL